MKKLLKSTLLLAMTLAIILSCTTNALAGSANPKMLAEAVLYGENLNEVSGYSVHGSIPLEVKINPDNPDEVINNVGGTASKEEFIKYLNELIDENIARFKRSASYNTSVVFDEPNNRDCNYCPGRALERAKGTFYQDYVYNHWKQINEIYSSYKNSIPSVEAFFAAEGITLNNVTPAPTPTPTPVPTTPPKAVEKINDIKNKTDVENTLLVIDTDGVLTLAVNGEIVQFPDVQPFIDVNSRTQIPVRAVAETFNCEVNWDGRISTAIINGNNKLITIAINSDIITVNGVDTKMDTTATLKDDRTCVPIRYIAEALGLTVKYEKV